MDIIEQLLGNQPLMAALVAWALAQIIKILLNLVRHGRLDWRLFVAPGGMPSSHSSLVMGLACSTGLNKGVDSIYFAITVVLALVVMYDAQGVRRQAGEQAHIINLMVLNIENTGVKLDKNLKEILGHTPIQVIAGAILGLVVAIVMYH